MHTKLTSLASGDTIATTKTACVDELHKVLGTDAYNVLEVTPDGLEKLAGAPCSSEVLEGLKAALGDADSLLVGYHGSLESAAWTINGTIRDRGGDPIAGVRVLAYDKDFVKKDDYLGCAFTDAEGKYSIAYHEDDFKSGRALVDFEGNPDLYLSITDVAADVTKTTETKEEAKQNEHFELKVDFDSETELLRSIVGYCYIEEDALEQEIEDLEHLIKEDPDDAQAHFHLGLCFIEMMKTDLRRSEWLIPESRIKDDVLAVTAIQEFEEVASLDPAREREAEKYRKYVLDLQDLAL